MAKIKTNSSDLDNEAKITLGLLTMVHDDSSTSQRSMAGDLGIALGLTNAYLKRCVKKGLIKVSQVPANRYTYYLTPKGFSEKSRLTAEFLTQSFNLFRHARAEGMELFNLCQNQGWKRVALYGISDMTEIMILTARDYDVELISVIDSEIDIPEFSGLPVTPDLPGPDDTNAIIICVFTDPQPGYDAVTAAFPAERVLAPKFLGIKTRSGGA